jgi:hypothetical protein
VRLASGFIILGELSWAAVDDGSSFALDTICWLAHGDEILSSSFLVNICYSVSLRYSIWVALLIVTLAFRPMLRPADKPGIVHD